LVSWGGSSSQSLAKEKVKLSCKEFPSWGKELILDVLNAWAICESCEPVNEIMHQQKLQENCCKERVLNALNAMH